MKFWKQPAFIGGLVILTLTTAIILFGQLSSKVDLPLGDEYVISLKFEDSVDEVTAACEVLNTEPERLENLMGCEKRIGKMCYIVTLPDTEILFHELRHCFEGAWHK